MWNGAGSVTPGIDDLKEFESRVSSEIFDSYVWSEMFYPESFEMCRRVTIWRDGRFAGEITVPTSIDMALAYRILGDRMHQVRRAFDLYQPTRSIGCIPMLELEAA